MDASAAIQMAQEHDVEVVDLKFCDLPGLWQHFSIPFSALTEEVFEDGIGYDGSSIRGFQSIHESDMLLMPDPATTFLDPFTEAPTLSLIGNIRDPVTRQPYSRDPRFVAQKAEQYLSGIGIADTSFWGPEIEFYIFDSVAFDQTHNRAFYRVDSIEGFWNTGDESRPNLGYKPRYKEGYFPVPPMDHMQDLRTEMMRTLQRIGVNVEVHHHEVGTAGQAEIDMSYAPLTRMADQVLMYKYVVKNVALQHGKTVTMMPKPVFMDNGSGMHTHQSLWKDNENMFFGSGGYGSISETARHYIGGLLQHADALCAFIAPSTNSYRRLVAGYEAPINLVYSQRNRSACVRIPMYSDNPKSKRVEFRTADPSCNPYYAFAAMLMAGLDGIEQKIEPPEPIDKDLYDLPPEIQSEVRSVVGSLEEALEALENDYEFLMKGDVFTEDVLETWIRYKREREVDAIRVRPHPYEFALYYDI